MSEKEKLLQDFDASTEAMLGTFADITPGDFNRHVDGGWSAGDIAEHIYLLERRVNEIFKNAGPTERPHHLKVEPVRLAMKDPNQKFKAPEFILPSKEEKNKEDILKKLQQVRQHMREMIQNHDISETVTEKHFVIGSMSRMEWVYFLIHHTYRHLEQMKHKPPGSKTPEV